MDNCTKKDKISSQKFIIKKLVELTKKIEDLEVINPGSGNSATKAYVNNAIEILEEALVLSIEGEARIRQAEDIRVLRESKEYTNGAVLGQLEIVDLKIDSKYDAAIDEATALIQDLEALLNQKILLTETSITQNALSIALKADRTALDLATQNIIQNSAELRVQADMISLKVGQVEFDQLGNTVALNTSAIEQTAMQIALKVNQTVFDDLSNVVQLNSSSITQQAGLIALKVNQTDFNSLNTIVGQNSSSITQQANEIALKVDKVEFDDLSNIVEQNSSSITQQAGQIALKVDQTVYNTLNNIVLQNSSSIVQQANEIALKVDQTDFDDLNNIVEQNSSSIIQQAEEISLKVDQTIFDDLSDTVESNSTSIIQQAGEIALKANQSSLNILNGTVSSHTSSIALQANQIALKVDQSTYDELENTVTTQGSSITQQAGLIALKVSQSELTTQLGTNKAEAIASSKTYTDTQISLTNGQISLKADKTVTDSLTSRLSSAELKITPEAIQQTVRSQTETIVNTSIDNIEIGGANKLVNSDKGFSHFAGYNNSVLTKTNGTVAMPEFGFTDGNRVVTTGGASITKAIAFLGVPKTGEKVSVSIFIKNNSTTKALIINSNQGDKSVTLQPSEARRVKLENISGNNTGQVQVAVRTILVADNADFTWSRIKYEFGDKSTDWSPASEDLKVQTEDLISDIKLGGTNLIPNSKTFGYVHNVNNIAPTYATGTNAIGVNERICLLTYQATTNNYYRIVGIVKEKNTQYTFSCWMSRQGNSAVNYQLIYKNVVYKTVAIGETWQRVFFTFTSGEDINIYDFVQITSALASANGVWMYEPKLEKGNKATEWSPAPGDIEAVTEGLKTRVTSTESSITTLSNSISLKSDKTVTDALTARISSAELKITPTAIQQTVRSQTETIVNNSINNISIGARNYLATNGFSLYLYHTGTLVDGVLTATRAGATDILVFRNKNLSTADLKGEFTFSAYLKINGNIPTRASLPLATGAMNTQGGTKVKVTYDETTGFIVMVHLFNGVGTNWFLHTNLIPVEIGSVITLEQAKFERGNIPTAWSPAYEDIDKRITNTESSITTLSNSIALKADKTVTDGLINRVNAAELKITPDAINLTVANQIKSKARGKLLFRDPMFEDGLNGVILYNNLPNGNVAVIRETAGSEQPTGKSTRIKIRNMGTADPSLGGFYIPTFSYANAKFITRIIALIPVGRQILFASNSIGTGGNSRWLTSNEGTGQWTEYVYEINAGSSGNFSSTNFFFITGAVGTPTAPVDWYVCFLGVYDLNQVDDTPTVDEIKAGISVQSNAIRIFGQDISLAGKVTFTSLDQYAQETLNNASSTATSALGTANTALFRSTIFTPAPGIRKILNPTGFSGEVNALGAVMLYTPILNPFMFNIKIIGYLYLNNSKTDIDLTITGYAYTATSILNYNYTSNGSFTPTIELARDSAGRLVIKLGETNSVWQYPKLMVESCILSHSVAPDSYKDGWSMALVTTLPTLVGSVRPSGVNVRETVGDWTFTNTTEINGAKIRTGTITADKINTLNLVARHIATSTNTDALTVNENNDNSIKIRHSNGVVGIEMGLVNGEPRLIFNNSNGAKVWEGGMQGIIYVNNVPASWTTVQLTQIRPISSESTNYTPLELEDYINSKISGGTRPAVLGGTNYYLYNEGVNAQASANAQYAGYHITNTTTSAWMPSGYYATSGVMLSLNIEDNYYYARVFKIWNGKIVDIQRLVKTELSGNGSQI